MPEHPSVPAGYDPQSLLNSQPVIVTVIDPATHGVQFQNETGIKQFGDIAGKPCYEAIAGQPSPCRFCKMSEAMATAEITSNEVALPNNRHLLVHWSKTVTTDGAVHVIETITDITERKRLEEALRQAQKMEAVGRMAGGIAHDFNNLLMVINGYSDRMLREFGSHPGSQRLELIKQAGVRAAALTQKLLAFSRQQVLQQSVVSPTETIRNMESLMRGIVGERAQLVIDCDPQSGSTCMDPVQLEQVILNLLVNARDAISEGGQITIRTANVDLDEAYVAAHPWSRRGRYVAVTVADTGNGMDDETQAHMFDPFFTTKAMGKGTGLGLTTVYGIIKQYQGYIDVESRLGHGARFTIYFPRSFESQEPPAVTPVCEKPGDMVAVVEDEGTVRLFVAEILKGAGYRVIEAANGAEGIEAIRRSAEPCRLVVTDVMMPEMTGPAMVKRLRASFPDLHVLFMSGYTADLLESNGIGGPIHFLQKPILPDVLLSKVEAMLTAR